MHMKMVELTYLYCCGVFFFFFQAEDGIRDWSVTGVQTCALPICRLICGGIFCHSTGANNGSADYRTSQQHLQTKRLRNNGH